MLYFNKIPLFTGPENNGILLKFRVHDVFLVPRRNLETTLLSVVCGDKHIVVCGGKLIVVCGDKLIVVCMVCLTRGREQSSRLCASGVGRGIRLVV